MDTGSGAREWLVISNDKRIRTRAEENRSVKENGVGIFILSYKHPSTGGKYTGLLPNREKHFTPTTNTPRGHIQPLKLLP